MRLTFNQTTCKSNFKIRLRTSNIYTSNKRKWLSPEIITDTDSADDIGLLANAPGQAESQLYNREQTIGGIGFQVNANKTGHMNFKREEVIYTYSVRLLKLVIKFTYLRSSISSTETDVWICLAKAWTAIDSCSFTWKSVRFDKIKQGFFLILRTGAVIELQRAQGWRTFEHISCHQSLGTWVWRSKISRTLLVQAECL